MLYKYVKLTVQEKTGIIEFNYTQKMNAFSGVFANDIIGAINEYDRPGINCLILRAPQGAKVFSAGYDISELPRGSGDPLDYSNHLRRLIRAIQHCSKPVIAMVEGSVWGGAFEVVMSADIIIAAADSTFAMTPANLSMPYNMAGLHNLLRDAGHHIMKEMIFTAAPISAGRAREVGIVNHVLPAAELEAFTLRMAQGISEKASLAIAVMKEEMRLLGEANPLNSAEYERIQGMRRAVYNGQDYQEGLKAFAEKRKPHFQGK